MPFKFDDDFWLSHNFWIGLLFVTFPLNYFVYGLNDYNDFRADEANDRKGNFLFGAKSTKEQLASLPSKITWVILPFMAYFTYTSGWKMLLMLVFMVFINVVYNFKPFRIKERPPLEICIQTGYVGTAVFSVLLNDLSMLPDITMLYLSLFAFQAHIAGEIMDIEPDIQAGKLTTATRIGRKNTKCLMILLLFIEVIILAVWINDFVLAGFLTIFTIWLCIDTFLIFKDEPYSVKQMKLFGYAMNLSALFSMIWILYSGKLIQ